MSKAREFELVGGLQLHERPNGPPGNSPRNIVVDGPLLNWNEKCHVIEKLPDTIQISRRELERLLSAIEEYRMDVLEHRSAMRSNALDKEIGSIETHLASHDECGK